MTDWKNPEEVRAYHRAWSRKHKGTRLPKPEAKPRSNGRPMGWNSYWDIDPDRPLDPVPDALMDAETWHSLTVYEEMSRPGDICWLKSRAEQTYRLARLRELITPQMIEIDYDQMTEWIRNLAPASFHRLHQKPSVSNWYICAETVIKEMHRLGFCLSQGRVRFYRPEEGLREFCSSSAAVDRKIRNIYGYYPLDMAPQVREISAAYLSLPEKRRGI